MFGKSIIAVALAAVALAQDLKVNSPAALIQCQPALLTWEGGSAPYYLAAIPGGQPSAAALKNFPTQNGTSLTWTVDIASGTSVTIKVTDSNGNVNYNSAVTIQPGSSDSCLSGASASNSNVVGGSATAAASGAASSASSAAGSATSAASSAGNAASSVSRAATSAASAASGNAASAASSVRSSGASAASGAAAAASSTGAAGPFAVADMKAGAFAVLLGAAGLTLF